MVEISLYTVAEDERVLEKTLNNKTDFNCIFKDSNSIIAPVLTITTQANLTQYNYCYVPDFNRYYFIDDITITRNGVYNITLRCDVLMTYATSIKNSEARITRQENIGQDFLVDALQPVYAFKNTTVKKFPYPIGDKNNLQFILTVGGSN